MQASESLDALELPALDLRSKLRHFGPGMMIKGSRSCNTVKNYELRAVASVFLAG
jgi:hypothetical protein